MLSIIFFTTYKIQNYFFYYNKIEKYSLIYPSSEVKKILYKTVDSEINIGRPNDI